MALPKKREVKNKKRNIDMEVYGKDEDENIESNMEMIGGNARVTTEKNLIAKVQLEGDFNLTDDEEMNSFLKIKAKELLIIQANSSLDLGKIFEEVHEKLSGKNQYDGAYVQWLERNGYNKMTALRHRRRHQMYTLVNSDQGKAFVATLPVKVIDSIYRYEDFSGIISVIDDGITRAELESMMVDPVSFVGVDILPYNPKQTQKVYNNASKLWKAVYLEKVSDENSELFEKDMKKVVKILSRWQKEEEK